MIDHLREAGVLVAHLQRALLDGSRDLAQVPVMLKRIIADGMWAERTDPLSGRRYGPFTSFEHFVATPRDEGGLGSTIRQLQGLCKDDPEAKAALTTATQRQQGGDRKSEDYQIKFDNIQLDPSPTGTSESAALRRLRKDRPDLHERVLAGELKANAAMVEAGFRHHTLTIRTDDPESAARTLRTHMSPEDLVELVKLLQD